MASEKCARIQDNFGFEKSDSDDSDHEGDLPTTSKGATSLRFNLPAQSAAKHGLENDDEYDFDVHLKKSKLEPSPKLRSIKVPKARIVSSKDGNKVYTHKWGSDDEDESGKPAPQKHSEHTSTYQRTRFSAISKKGDSDNKEFDEDLEYFMETLDSNAAQNLKLIGLSKLVRKCSQFEFRQFMRKKPQTFDNFVKIARKLITDQGAALIMAVFFYMFSRDKHQFPQSRAALQFILELLRSEKPSYNSAYAANKEDVWQTLTMWKEECDRRKQRPILFDLTLDHISVSSVTLVTLDYVVARAPVSNKALQACLLDLGFLPYLVARIDKTVLSLKLSTNLSSDLLLHSLSELEHAYRVLENLGQVGNFLHNSLVVMCSLIPQYAPKERALDVKLLLCGLLINMTEKCASNRKKVTSMKVPSYVQGESAAGPVPVLEALAKMFIAYEGNARIVDAELDNELMEELPADGQEDEEEDDVERMRAAMNNDEMISVLNSAMRKATSHMHDSMMASYLGLLIGCLVQNDETLASQVKQHMPSNNLIAMVEQLERFHEFAQLTKSVDVHCIEAVISSLRLVSA